jgi:hypothetical protein
MAFLIFEPLLNLFQDALGNFDDCRLTLQPVVVGLSSSSK